MAFHQPMLPPLWAGPAFRDWDDFFEDFLSDISPTEQEEIERSAPFYGASPGLATMAEPQPPTEEPTTRRPSTTFPTTTTSLASSSTSPTSLFVSPPPPSRPHSRHSAHGQAFARSQRGVSECIDLTGQASMSSTHGKRRTSSDVASSDRPQIKRRKASSKVPRPDLLASRQGIEEVDLCGDDDEEAAELLRKQREDQIKEQEKNSPKARKLTNLQCIICFEPPTDMTVTACGHFFCFGCLLPALNATEPNRSRCPVCRATIKRGRKQTDYIPLELKLASRKRLPEGVAVE